VIAPMARRSESTLAEVGEIEILERITTGRRLPPDVVVGPGDDCALIRLGGRSWIWTTDCQIENTHFDRRWMTPRQIGRKAYLVNASDIAAMGGSPRFALVSLAAPAELPARDLAAVQRGIVAAAEEDGAAVVGGNLARAPGLEVTVSLLGAAPRRAVLRSGGRPGDALYVTGSLGEAALGLRLLGENPDSSRRAADRFRRPQPRLRAGAILAERGLASAMIDLSDGLSQDLGRLCRASRVGARIDLGSLPVTAAVRRAGVALALSGGEDYELLCAVPVRKEKLLSRLSGDFGCAMTRIGELTRARDGIVVIGDDASPLPGGFSHFSS
jgi:thiamine-monophosphate kinase